MADMGIHAIDTARYILGDPEPVSVYAKIGTYYKEMDVDDTGVVIVTWDNGTTSYLESGWWQVHRDGEEASTQVYGTVGFGSVFPTQLKIPSADRSDVEIIDPGFVEESDDDWLKMYDTQMAYFIDCIRSQTPPVPGGLEGLKNMQVVDAAYKSTLTGEVINL
jgi:predicted dehydrogenase